MLSLGRVGLCQSSFHMSWPTDAGAHLGCCLAGICIFLRWLGASCRMQESDVVLKSE